MKKHFFTLVIMLFALTANAQQDNISVGPKNFKSTIAIKISLAKKADLTVKIFDTNQHQVKQFKFKNTKTDAFKLDLETLTSNNYVVKVFSEEKLIYSKNITKLTK